MNQNTSKFTSKKIELFVMIFAVLFSIMNPFRTVPEFVSLTKEISWSEIK